MQSPLSPPAKYNLGDVVNFVGVDSIVMNLDITDGKRKYLILWNPQHRLTAWVYEEHLQPSTVNTSQFADGVISVPVPIFNKRTPDFVIQDNFYQNPQLIRDIALAQTFSTGPKDYKGKRTKERFLFPYIKERIEELLGVKITDWLGQPANGIFQITKYTDPLVWHSDRQTYAGAIYLTPDAPVSAGTSFWRNRTYGCRRPPGHPQEMVRNPDETKEQSLAKNNEMYSEYNLLHQDNWELVDKVGAVFNRLVLWDGHLVHSASSYESFTQAGESDNTEAPNSRLVQLFFFTTEGDHEM